MFSRGLILQAAQNLSLLMTATKIIYGQYLQETNTRTKGRDQGFVLGTVA